MNDNPINRQERNAIAARLGWTSHQVREAIRICGGPGRFREAMYAGTLPAPGSRQKPRRGNSEPEWVREIESTRH
jgi:hypothetical protein